MPILTNVYSSHILHHYYYFREITGQQFLTIWDTIGVKVLVDGPEGNKGYLRTISDEEEEDPLNFGR